MIYPDLHLRYVFSVLLSAHKAQLGATLFVFSSFMFSGAALPLPELRRVLPGPAFALLTRSSFIRWGVEAATICELQYWAAIYDVSMTLEVLGLQLDNFDTDMLAMFAMPLSSYSMELTLNPLPSHQRTLCLLTLMRCATF